MATITDNSQPIFPPERISLRANVAWTTCGNVVYAMSQWAMLASIAKLGSPYMVGQFALGLAVAAPVYMFTNLQLRSIQATDGKTAFDLIASGGDRARQRELAGMLQSTPR